METIKEYAIDEGGVILVITNNYQSGLVLVGSAIEYRDKDVNGKIFFTQDGDTPSTKIRIPITEFTPINTGFEGVVDYKLIVKHGAVDQYTTYAIPNDGMWHYLVNP